MSRPPGDSLPERELARASGRRTLVRVFLRQVTVGALGLLVSLVGAGAAADAAGRPSGVVVCEDQSTDGGACTELHAANGYVGVPVFLAGGGLTLLAVRRLGMQISAMR
jgi:hypothetical protein